MPSCGAGPQSQCGTVPIGPEPFPRKSFCINNPDGTPKCRCDSKMPGKDNEALCGGTGLVFPGEGLKSVGETCRYNYDTDQCDCKPGSGIEIYGLSDYNFDSDIKYGLNVHWNYELRTYHCDKEWTRDQRWLGHARAICPA